MGMTMKIEVVARETIKPSSPTPPHLRNFKLSFMDQAAPGMFIGLLLFYSVNDATDRHLMQAAQRSHHLKTSLSKLLTKLYPLAGIIKDQTTIECNDGGAQYVEGRVSCILSEILEQPDAFIILRNLFPIEIESTEADTGPILHVQANLFKCGGMVIGLCISHKIADAATLGIVIKTWSEIAVSGSSDSVKFPEFKAASVFPPVDYKIPRITVSRHNCITKRYVFQSSKIVELKAKAVSATVQQPTRVEAVTALIWKCMINISRSTKGFPRLSVTSHAVNLRKKTVPPLPENCIGNILGYYFAEHSTEEEIDLQGLVCKLRKELTEFNKTALHDISIEKMAWTRITRTQNLVRRDDVDYSKYTSWCRFPIYEADFGWGKPTWATVPNMMHKNLIYLLDTRDGEGIEALVSLSREDMALFEGEKELLEFAVVDPNVVMV